MKTYLITTTDNYGKPHKHIVNAHSEGEALKRVEISSDITFLQIKEVI